jgi:hypothetical protein
MLAKNSGCRRQEPNSRDSMSQIRISGRISTGAFYEALTLHTTHSDLVGWNIIVPERLLDQLGGSWKRVVRSSKWLP